jgi:3-methyl-2-oxobutanoate hydroxymethyltransferase
MSYIAPQDGNIRRKKRRVTDVLNRKGGQPLTALTCYDAAYARILEKTDLDLILVGDSLGHVIQGLDSTLGVTIDDVAYHTRCVARSLKTPLLVSDLPFGSAGFSDERLFADAEKLMRSGAEAVKIEGASEEVCRQIRRLVDQGVPVVGHIGLIPQSVHALGGYKVQGRDEKAQQRLVTEALRLEAAGCFSIVLELVNETAAQAVTAAVQIPTIGIGSGNQCDGQILVLHDMLGLNAEFKPKFLKHFAQLEELVVKAVADYCSEVSDRAFPAVK